MIHGQGFLPKVRKRAQLFNSGSYRPVSRGNIIGESKMIMIVLPSPSHWTKLYKLHCKTMSLRLYWNRNSKKKDDKQKYRERIGRGSGNGNGKCKTENCLKELSKVHRFHWHVFFSEGFSICVLKLERKQRMCHTLLIAIT